MIRTTRSYYSMWAIRTPSSHAAGITISAHDSLYPSADELLDRLAKDREQHARDDHDRRNR
jgi:hypothetical protein